MQHIKGDFEQKSNETLESRNVLVKHYAPNHSLVYTNAKLEKEYNTDKSNPKFTKI